MTNKLDDIDKKILNLLQNDGELALQPIAKAVNLSPTPCWRRIQRLKKEGYIRKTVALLERDKLQLSVELFIMIETSSHSEDWLKNFEQKIESYPEVLGCYRTIGSVDYILHTIHQDMPAYDAFYKKLITLPDLKNVSAVVVMESIKETTKLPIAD